MPKVLVKQIKQSTTFDVFTGDGWNNWSRVAWDMKRKRLSLVKGNRLKPNELKEVYTQVEVLLHHLKEPAL